MPYNENLAQRVREVLAGTPDVSERKMFGGIAFLTRGNMACGVHQDALILRFDPDDHDAMMARPHVRVFDLSGGRPIKGWLLVDPEGVASAEALSAWVRAGVEFALSLPAK